MIQCINIAKNDLVKGIIYHGSKIHGFEIRIKHTKNRLPGIFSDDFLVRKCNIDYQNKDVIIVDDDDKLKQNFHTDEVNHTVNICNLVKSPSKNKFIETISNLRKKIVDLECENKKLKQELVAAETIMTKDKQNCLPKTAKDMQTNLKMMKENTQEKDILPTSPALSFFTSSSDVTEVREFKRRCLRNRERNKKFEKEFAIQKKIYWAIKKRNENEKINTPTVLHFPPFLLILRK